MSRELGTVCVCGKSLCYHHYRKYWWLDYYKKTEEKRVEKFLT